MSAALVMPEERVKCQDEERLAWGRTATGGYQRLLTRSSDTSNSASPPRLASRPLSTWQVAALISSVLTADADGNGIMSSV